MIMFLSEREAFLEKVTEDLFVLIDWPDASSYSRSEKGDFYLFYILEMVDIATTTTR